jgi:hypothetical protein
MPVPCRRERRGHEADQRPATRARPPGVHGRATRAGDGRGARLPTRRSIRGRGRFACSIGAERDPRVVVHRRDLPRGSRRVVAVQHPRPRRQQHRSVRGRDAGLGMLGRASGRCPRFGGRDTADGFRMHQLPGHPASFRPSVELSFRATAGRLHSAGLRFFGSMKGSAAVVAARRLPSGSSSSSWLPGSASSIGTHT